MCQAFTLGQTCDTKSSTILGDTMSNTGAEKGPTNAFRLKTDMSPAHKAPEEL
jgi:hypothetical protein